MESKDNLKHSFVFGIIVDMELPISIIIPTFNEGKYLPRLLRSIQKQSIQPKEIIVADAFSTDATRYLAKKFGCKIIDGGLPAKARNTGAKAATQELLLFLDADVVLPKNFLEKTLTEMSNRNLDIASCFVKPISSYTIDAVLHELSNYYLQLTKQFHPHIPGCCIFVKKSLHMQIKGFDESLELAEDHDYLKRAKLGHKFGYLTSYKIPISVRRLTKEGRIKIVLKYIAIELHLVFLGKIDRNTFSYQAVR